MAMGSFDQRIAAIAAEQKNVIDFADVVRAGGTHHHVETRMAAARWLQPHPGVYIIGCADPTWEQRVRAALKACGEGAYPSHETLAALHRLDGAEEREEIQITMGQSQRPVPEGVHVFRSRRPVTETRRVRGLVGTSIERCLIDYSSVADAVAVERAVESALDQRLTAETRIWRALSLEGGRGVPGAARLRKVMLTRPRGLPAKSVLEIELGHVLIAGGLGHYVRNFPVPRTKYKIDAAFVDDLVAVEADSRRFHSTKTQVERDARRQEALEAMGWHFERVTFDQVYRDPAGTLVRIRTALADRRAARSKTVLSTSTPA